MTRSALLHALNLGVLIGGLLLAIRLGGTALDAWLPAACLAVTILPIATTGRRVPGPPIRGCWACGWWPCAFCPGRGRWCALNDEAILALRPRRADP